MTDKKGLFIDVKEGKDSASVMIEYHPVHRDEDSWGRYDYSVNRGETLTITYELKVDSNGHAESKVVRADD